MNKFQQPGKVRSVDSSILTPESGGLRMILSINNMAGKYENPLLPIFDKKWRKVREESRGWFATREKYKLGELNTTAVQSDTWVIHMLCQDADIKTDEKALETCIKSVSDKAKFEKASVHISSLLSDLLPSLNNLVTKYFINEGINVYYYTKS